MKRNKIITSIFLSAFAVLFLSSCEEFADQFAFDVDGQTITFDMVAAPNPAGEFVYVTDLSDINLDSVINAQGVDPDAIQDISFEEATIDIVGDGNFDAFGSVEAWLSASNMNDMLLASADSIAEGAKQIPMQLATTSAKDILDGTGYSFALRGDLKQALEDTLVLKGTLKYKIKVSFVQAE
ncbi:MAG: hypothetical protein HC896_13275 [Bacteroidales bacterium]|nr:hypothetical protein [Bacteroidales bacterium]